MSSAFAGWYPVSTPVRFMAEDHLMPVHPARIHLLKHAAVRGLLLSALRLQDLAPPVVRLRRFHGVGKMSFQSS